MPYIQPHERPQFDEIVVQLASKIATKGQLNYCITQLIQRCIKRWGIRYDTIADISGVLHNVEAEFDRRIVAEYEDRKIAANGDVDFTK